MSPPIVELFRARRSALAAVLSPARDVRSPGESACPTPMNSIWREQIAGSRRPRQRQAADHRSSSILQAARLWAFELLQSPARLQIPPSHILSIVRLTSA